MAMVMMAMMVMMSFEHWKKEQKDWKQGERYEKKEWRGEIEQKHNTIKFDFHDEMRFDIQQTNLRLWRSDLLNLNEIHVCEIMK